MARAEFDWKAQGMTFFYNGSSEVTFNENPESDDTVFGQAQQHAKDLVCRRGGFSHSSVTISNVKLLG